MEERQELPFYHFGHSCVELDTDALLLKDLQNDINFLRKDKNYLFIPLDTVVLNWIQMLCI